MKYPFTTLKSRFPFIQKELGDKISDVVIGDKLKDMEEYFVNFQIQIDNNFDLIQLFHAGINCGCDFVINSRS